MKNSLKNPDKADLDGDGVLTSYEEKRGRAIDSAMSNQVKKKKFGGMAVQGVKDPTKIHRS